MKYFFPEFTSQKLAALNAIVLSFITIIFSMRERDSESAKYSVDTIGTSAVRSSCSNHCSQRPKINFRDANFGHLFALAVTKP